MLIFLIGYMGSGKTTLGRELAVALDYGFMDMDELLETALGMSIQECFDMHGEELFRFAEHELLKSIITGKDTIVSAGGGTPCFYDNMQMMNRAGVTVYLQVSVDELYERLKDEAETRPLLRDGISTGLKDFISKHLQEREKCYGQAQIVFHPSISNVDLLVKRLSVI